MGIFRTYLLRIIAAAFICSIINTLSGKTAHKNVMQFLSAMALLVVVLGPLSKFQITDADWEMNDLFQESKTAVDEGTRTVEKATAAIITEKTSAYIVEKAAAHGAEVQATVQLDGTIPRTVEIAGQVSPYVQSILSAWIESELGISREAQNWNLRS